MKLKLLIMGWLFSFATLASESIELENVYNQNQNSLDMRIFYDKAAFLGDAYHFVPRTRIVNGHKVSVYETRALVRYGFRRNSKLSNLHNCPVMFHIYLAEDGFPIFRKVDGQGEGFYPELIDLIAKDIHPILPNGQLAGKLEGQLSIPECVASEVSVLCDKVVEMMPNVDPTYANTWFKNFRQINSKLETLEELDYLLKRHPDSYFLQYQIPEIFVKMLRDYFSQIPFHSRNAFEEPKFLSKTKGRRGDFCPDIDYWSPQILYTGTENQVEFYGKDLDEPMLIFFGDKQGEIIATNANRSYEEKILVHTPIIDEPQDLELSLVFFRDRSYFKRVHNEKVIFRSNKEYKPRNDTNVTNDN